MRSQPDITEFRVLRDRLKEACGMYFEDDKYPRVAKIVALRMSELGIACFDDYRRVLTTPPGNRDELEALAALLSIGETQFLRNKDHWRAFRECVLPSILERNAATGARRIRIWSAGCSSGEEAYSAGLALSQALPDLAQWSIEIVGTDINPVAIAAAHRALYTENSFRGVPPEIRQAYFETAPGGRYRPRADIREMARFQTLNLLDQGATAQMRGFDVIFCRNVLIYFDPSGIERVMACFHRSLNPDGYLFLGHAESMLGNAAGFANLNVCNTFIHQLATSVAPAAESANASPIPADDRATEAPASADIVAMPAAASLDALRARAIEHLCAEENSEARRAFEEVLRREPNDTESLLGMALLLAGSGGNEAALRHCESVLQVQPMSADAYCVMALIHEGLGEHAIARREFENALYLDGGFSIAHFRLAGLHSNALRHDDAMREFNNTLKALPDDDEQRVRFYSGGFSREVIAQICEQRLGIGHASVQDAPPVTLASNS